MFAILNFVSNLILMVLVIMYRRRENKNEDSINKFLSYQIGLEMKLTDLQALVTKNYKRQSKDDKSCRNRDKNLSETLNILSIKLKAKE